MGIKLVAFLRALAILAVVWGVLALVGFGAGALPPPRGGEAAAAPGGSDAGPRDAGAAQFDGAAAADAAEATDEAAMDEAATEGAAPAGLVPGPRWRALVCEDADTALPGATAALAVGDAIGDEKAEAIVACGGEVHLIGFVTGNPLRVARVDGDAGRAMRPVPAFFSGATRPDLLIGHAALNAAGDPSGGTLRLLRGQMTGGLAEPELLVDAPVVAAAVIDGDRSGLAAVTWPDAHGVRPSELWVFAGGASPNRRARVRLGHDGGDVVAFDLDADGVLEIVTVDRGHVRTFDAGGAPGASYPVPGGRRLLGLQDGARRELWVAGDGLHRLRDGVLEPIEAPPGVRGMVALDADDDGDPDVVAVTRDALVALLRDGEGVRAVPLSTFPSTLRPHDLAVYDEELLVVAAAVRGWELLSLPLTPSRVPAEEAEPLPDAPLVLRWRAP